MVVEEAANHSYRLPERNSGTSRDKQRQRIRNVDAAPFLTCACDDGKKVAEDFALSEDPREDLFHSQFRFGR